MSTKSTNVIEHFVLRSITPILVIIVSFLLKSKLDSIEDSMKTVQVILIEQGKLNVRMDGAESDIRDLKAKLGQVKTPAKQEDQITLSSLTGK